MKVKAKITNSFMNKDEWYEVIEKRDNIHLSHTGKKDFWYFKICVVSEIFTSTYWTSSDDFYTVEELREKRLNEILNEILNES